MEAAQGVTSAALGFLYYHIFTHNSKYFKNKLPTLKFKSIEISPNIKIKLQKRVIWIHHWMTMALMFLVLSYKSADFSHFLLLKGFCLGGMLQGFTFKDRFNIFIKS